MIESPQLSDFSGNIMDFLTCGQCQKEFPLQQITTFIQHKRKDCGQHLQEDGDFYSRQLNCLSCSQIFYTAWALLKHIEFKHELKLFLEKHPSRSLPYYEQVEHNVLNDTSESQHSTENANLSDTQSVGKSDHVNVSIVEASLVDGESDRNDWRKKAQFSTHGGDMCGTTGTNVKNSTDKIKQSSNNLTTEGRGVFPVAQDNHVGTTAKVNNSTSTDTLVTENSLCGLSLPCERTTVDEHAYSETCAVGSDKQSSVSRRTNSEEHGDLTDEFTEEDSQKGQPDNSDLENIQCCDNVECGVSVVPGTHENMKKCCASIVPKKRKRHMETKHAYTFCKALRKKSFAQRCKMSRLSNKSESSGTIYIDVGSAAYPVSSGSYCLTQHQQMGKLDDSNSTTKYSVSEPSLSGSNIQDGLISTHNNNGAVMNKGSLILKPGSVLTIPISSSFLLPHYKTALVPVIAKNSIIPEKTPPSNAAVTSTSAIQNTTSTKPVNNAPFTSTNVTNQSSTVGSSVPVSDMMESSHNISSAPLTIDLSDTRNSSGQTLYIDQSYEVTDTFDSPGGKGKKRRYPTSRPFKCDQCEHCFNQRIHLKKHQSKHTGIKPYKCQQCDYSTVERSHLKVHIRIHTGEKPFKCTYCEYATAQNSTLKIHLKRHHGGKMLECKSCNKKFTQQETLQKHESVDHNKTTANAEESSSDMPVICTEGPQDVSKLCTTSDA